MWKIFGLLFLFFIIVSGKYEVFSYKSLNIVSREQWGAIEEYRYLDSQEWKDIIDQENIKIKNNNNFISDIETIKYLQKPEKTSGSIKQSQ